MTAHHPGEHLLRRYARGDDDIAADQLWAVESHLETCAACRGRLTADPIAEAVWTGLAPLLEHTPQMTPARRWRRRLAAWVSPTAGPWLAMILVVVLVAFLLDRVSAVAPGGISLVLLIAPVLPVLGVAASWGRALDPGYELTASTPRAGLPLVFRRTAAVLAVVVPALFATGASLTQWLLPCLAFTAGTLALGGLIGVTRAAAALVTLWAAAIVIPAVAFSRAPEIFGPAATPLWATAFALGLLVITLRRNAFARLRANR